MAAIIFIFVLPEKMRHTANAITKMIDAAYLFLGRVTRYFLTLAFVAVIVYGLYHLGSWREPLKSANRSSAANYRAQIQEPSAKDLANAEWQARQKNYKHGIQEN